MSVDHQARSGESGVFAEDTVVVFFEPLEEAWCYVHHLTLLDIHARGYVRPICFTYATRDNQKIMQNFQMLLKNFAEVSNVLKTGNYQLFRDDLKMRMADLAYTKGVVDTMEGASMITGFFFFFFFFFFVLFCFGNVFSLSLFLESCYSWDHHSSL